MAGSECESKTAEAVIVVWRIFLGVASRASLGEALHFSVCVCVCLSNGKPTLLSVCVCVCVFLLPSFGASVQVYVSCHASVRKGVHSKSPAGPQSSWHGERRRESSWRWSSSHMCILLIPDNAKTKQRTDMLLTVYLVRKCRPTFNYKLTKL